MNDTIARRAAIAVLFTNVKLHGPVLYHELACAIGVFDSPGGKRSIGVATPTGGNLDGLALWSLHVRGVEVPGRFVIVDGAFWLEPVRAD